jgi:tRNA1Val (adenine37-N6)-methyltransferase
MGRNGRRIIQTQHFTIHDDQCAMKIGTDALLLGAWMDASRAMSIVDIGTGSGILLLMLAQRAMPGARLIGLELNEAACAQATSNLEASPFESEIVHCDALKWLRESSGRSERFDLLACNPPFFRNKPLGPDEARNLARHDVFMPIEVLLASAKQSLSEKGQLCLVWPADRREELAKCAQQNGFHIVSDCQVQGHPQVQPLRHLLSLQQNADIAPAPTEFSTLIIEEGPRVPGGAPLYSAAYKQLLGPYFPQLISDS